MAELPDGVVTFLFTDIEGSTRLLERDPRALSMAMARHHVLLADLVTGHSGSVFETVGDAVYAAFGLPADALGAAAAMQRAMSDADWGPVGELRIRIAVHTESVERRGDHYFGAPLFACARIQALAHGGQVLVSAATMDATRDEMPEGLSLVPLGPQRLRDLADPVVVAQLAAPGLVSAFPPLRGTAADRSTLPASTSTLVGREHDLERLLGRIADGRLVTVTGTGGTGKTRLALEAARRLGPTFDDGAHLVELAPVADPARVPDAIAAALRVRPLADQPVMEAIRIHLVERETMLVIDTCEHLLPGVAQVVTRLLGDAPNLRVLATSRVPLGVAGEVRSPLEPLDPRDAGARLFLERARAIDPGFTVGDTEWSSVVELCRRLDGLPLAIELAAARVSLASPTQMLARLPAALDLAAGHLSGRDDRQCTMRATIAWSVDLLAGDARQAFAALAVFVGAFDLDAAAAVLQPLVEDPLGLIASLLDQSLLARRPEDDRGEPRFGYLDTVREYATESLSADPAVRDATLLRHARWFATVTDQARDDLERSEVLRGLAALSRDMAEIEVAITRSAAMGAGDLACQMAADLADYHEIRGGRGRGVLLLQTAVAASPVPSIAHGRALNALGMHLQRLNDPHAEEVLVAARAMGLDLGHEAIAADAETNLGTVAHRAGRVAGARDWYTSAGRRWHAVPGPLTMHHHAPAGCMNLEQFGAGVHERLRVSQELVDAAQALGNGFMLELTLHNLGEVQRESGDLAASLRSSQDAVRLAQALDCIDGLLDDLDSVAETMMAMGEWAVGTTVRVGCDALSSARVERPAWFAADPVDWRAGSIAALGQEGYATAVAAGVSLRLDDLLELAVHGPSFIRTAATSR